MLQVYKREEHQILLEMLVHSKISKNLTKLILSYKIYDDWCIYSNIYISKATVS